MKLKKVVVAFFATALIAANGACLTVTAEDLNNIGAETTYSADTSDDSDEASLDTFKQLYGSSSVTAEEAQNAKTIATPAVSLLRLGMSVLLAVLPAIILLNSIVDLLCLSVSPLRKALIAVNGASGSGGGGGGFGGGFGGMGGMGGMGGGGGGSSQPQGLAQKIAQWASKEATDAVMESQPQGGSGGGGFGGGFGGMGGFGGGGGSAEPVKTKSLLVTYFKKRVVYLVVFGVCLIVFSGTAFTDLGLKLGAWIINKTNGVDVSV